MFLLYKSHIDDLINFYPIDIKLTRFELIYATWATWNININVPNSAHS